MNKEEKGYIILIPRDTEYKVVTVSALEPTGLFRHTPLVAHIVPTLVTPLSGTDLSTTSTSIRSDTSDPTVDATTSTRATTATTSAVSVAATATKFV